MSSETGKRNPDRLNMIGVVVVGICGAVLVYVSIALLQAFYMNDTAQVETMADYGGQDSTQRSIKAEQIAHIEPVQGVKNTGTETFSIKIDRAIDLIVEEAKQDPSFLVPSQGKSDRPSIQPVFGRPKALDTPPAGTGAGSGAAPAPGTGSGSAAGSGAAPPAPGLGSAGRSAPGAGGAPPPPPPAPAAGSGGHGP